MPEADRDEAIGRLLARVDATAAEPADGFPHYGDPRTGAWTRSPAGDWTGGFWNGMLWLTTVAREQPDDRRIALEWARRLLPRAESDTVFRGFLFWYGAALGAVLHDDEEAHAIALRGADGLASLYNPHARAIPLGTEAEEAERVGRTEANIDGVPGGTPLLAWAAANGGAPRLRELALANAERLVELCVRADGSVCQSASFDPETGAVRARYTHKGVTDDSTWLRAQAWAMLGFAQAAALDRDRFAGVATTVADWFVAHLAEDRVAWWDFDDPAIPDAPKDTSGTAIAAAALLKLAALVPAHAERYRTVAEEIVDALVARHLTPAGILADGCYNRRIGLATSNELIWGSYFLFEALLVLSGRLDATRV